MGVGLAIGGGAPAYCQSQIGNVYHADNQKGTVFIYAENNGFVPCTLTLTAKLVNAACESPLPGRFVIFPSKMPQVVTSITYKPGQFYTFDYSYSSQFGIYTGHAPDSSYVYELPFQRNTGVATRFFHNRFQRKLHHHYFFNLPENVPVRAAREGIVAAIRQDLPTAKGHSSNYIIVFHEDGTYAEYTNFNKDSAAPRLGQRVVKGEILCYASGLKKHWFRFNVQYPGTTAGKEISVIFTNFK